MLKKQLSNVMAMNSKQSPGKKVAPVAVFGFNEKKLKLLIK